MCYKKRSTKCGTKCYKKRYKMGYKKLFKMRNKKHYKMREKKRHKKCYKMIQKNVARYITKCVTKAVKKCVTKTVSKSVIKYATKSVLKSVPECITRSFNFPFRVEQKPLSQRAPKARVMIQLSKDTFFLYNRILKWILFFFFYQNIFFIEVICSQIWYGLQLMYIEQEAIPTLFFFVFFIFWKSGSFPVRSGMTCTLGTQSRKLYHKNLYPFF